MNYHILFSALCIFSASSLFASEWTPLFNGKDLAGWTPNGDVAVKIVDGVLSGTQKTPKGGNIISDTKYDDFELRFSYKVDWPANSGIWFRFNGRRGYQFDILKHPKSLSGGLFCPGKLFITANMDKSLEKQDDWNEGRVLADGSTLKLWLNGHLVGEAEDTQHTKGSIAIQVHGGKNFKNMAIHIRSIEIRPI
jgi:hypothetical protein